MLSKSNLRVLSILLCAALLATACRSDDPVEPEPTPDPEIVGAANDTIPVPFNGSVNLAELFQVEPPVTGNLTFSILRQVSYVGTTTVDGSVQEQENNSLDAFALNGAVLSSIEDVRVPDEFTRSLMLGAGQEARVVTQARLRITVAGNNEITPREVVIIQTEKPALVPTVSLAPGIEGERELATTGSELSFTGASFRLSDFYFSPEHLRIDFVNTAGEPISRGWANVIVAGGLDGAAGSGFVFAFHSVASSGEAFNAARQAALEAISAGTYDAVINVNVTYVAPDAIVRLVANPTLPSPNPFRYNPTGVRAFQLNNLVQLELNNEDLINFAATARVPDLVTGEDRPVGGLTIGEFAGNVEGQNPLAALPGWFTLARLPTNAGGANGHAIGDEIEFTITFQRADLFNHPDWTVRIKAVVVAP